MDDEDFEDLLAEADLLQDSSQESLTTTAANLAFEDDSEDEILELDAPASPPSSMEHDDSSVAADRQAGARNAELLDVLNVATSSPHVPTQFDHEPPHASDRTTRYTHLKKPLVNHSAGQPHSGGVIQQIIQVFEGIVDAMLNDKCELAITLKSRPKSTSRLTLSTKSLDEDTNQPKTRRICFPGKNEEEAWRFTVIIRILELIHEALSNDVVLSKRDIYYRDPALFNKQATVDRYIDDIAFTFGVPRSALNVTAVAKGLLVGTVRFCRRDGSIIDATDEREGMLAPSLRDILSVDLSAVKWILAVEKEASFRSIAASSFWSTTSTEGILITGKGYPDVATRALLHFLSTPSPQNSFASPPVYGLVDFDPDGLAILSVYKHGSLALAHENEELRVPGMQWLGLKAEDLRPDREDVHSSQGLLNLSARDRKKAVKMLERCEMPADGECEPEDAEMRRALQMMLMLGIKAELQLLDARPNGMVELLSSRLGGGEVV